MSLTEQLSVLWEGESKSLGSIIASLERARAGGGLGGAEYKTRTCVVRVQCMRRPCHCLLRNDNVLVLRVCFNVLLAVGQFARRMFTCTYPTESSAANDELKVVATQFSGGFFEILNANGDSVQYWTSVKELCNFRPKLFCLRKDLKCKQVKQRFEMQTGKTHKVTRELIYKQSVLVRAGTVLSYVTHNYFKIFKHKNRKPKEAFVVLCHDKHDVLLALHCEQKCAISPIASAKGISGVHTPATLFPNFRFPISVRTLFLPQLPVNPTTNTDRFRLDSKHTATLIFLAPLTDVQKLFVVTQSMMRDHKFFVGDTQLKLYQNSQSRFNDNVDQFLSSYHKYSALRHVIDRTIRDEVRAERGERQVEGEKAVTSTHMMDDIDEIYYYVRTGHFPKNSKSSELSQSLALVNSKTNEVHHLYGHETQSLGNVRVNRCDSVDGKCASGNAASSVGLFGSVARSVTLCEALPPPLPPRNYSVLASGASSFLSNSVGVIADADDTVNTDDTIDIAPATDDITDIATIVDTTDYITDSACAADIADSVCAENIADSACAADIADCAHAAHIADIAETVVAVDMHTSVSINSPHRRARSATELPSRKLYQGHQFYRSQSLRHINSK